MVFVKVVKDRSYFTRFQVKYRRRREGKTDYWARRNMLRQDNDSFNVPKYRVVVRFTNKDTIAQVVRAQIVGDFVYSSAYGHELTRYGIPVGHTNYAAGYAVGLLLARRTLVKAGLADKYVGQEKVTGEDFNVAQVEDGPQPFRAILDVGLKRTSTGSKVFATLKGVTDGGLLVPHNVNRFVGYDSEGKKLNTDVLRKHIFGAHVAEHMRQLKDDDPEAYEKKFSRYIKNKIGPDDIEKIYAKVHAAIRANPAPAPKKPENPALVHLRYHKLKLTRKQRLGNIKHHKNLIAKRAGATETADE